jgi:exoribonuclease-2
VTIDKAQFSELKAVAARVLRENGFEPEFSAEAQRQTAAIAGAPGNESGVRDLRELLWCSIDNDDSKDLDQLSVAEPLSGGTVKVLIAIADVDSLVPKDSPIDEHASTNTTSIYTAAGIYPMLPEKLSTDLTSLLQGKERLAMVAELLVSADGAIDQSEIYRALVLNRAKLAYGSVAAWLDGKAPPPPALHAVNGLEEQIRIQDGVAQLLRRKRHERGALSLETRGARATFDGSMLSDLRVEEKNRAQELIEDLMIAANSATARFLKSRRFPSLRRVLKAPARWDRIVAIAREAGGTLPPEPDAVALDDFLREQRQARPDDFPDLSLSVVKLLGSGEYLLELPDDAASGHFGLAVRDYTHSTAPNRRFPDLLTQRLLKAAISGGTSPYSPDELSDLAAHCSEQEKDASKIERQINKSAAALLLAPRVGEPFSGIVTGASEKGTWVRVEHPYAEGKIVRGFEGLDVGDRVRVRLDHVDSDRAFIDFSRIR